MMGGIFLLSAIWRDAYIHCASNAEPGRWWSTCFVTSHVQICNETKMSFSLIHGRERSRCLLTSVVSAR